MCTVTFIARQRGYCLGMNRDEKLTRATGLPPKQKKMCGRSVLSPTEPHGGTWIAVNDGGVTLALINWYAVTARVKQDPVSRGSIIKNLCVAVSPEVVGEILGILALRRINPFRLVAIYPATHEVAEWRWDLKKLTRQDHAWETQQWISSGFDERTAQRVRDQTFRAALRQRSAGSRNWLRRLHRNHSPAAGPFSTCMHRADAATVSYTEVAVAGAQVEMRYQAGSPCENARPLVFRL
jgi:hypothetical protein